MDAERLDAALAAWDAFFARFFPRSGLYSVLCSITTRIPPTTQPPICFALLPSVGHQETTIQGAGGLLQRFVSRSSLTYFIPKAPPGKQVQSARLPLRISVAGAPSTLRLNSKLPVTLDGLFCLPNSVLCFVTATWDFTEEARQLAAQGGSELVLTPGPVAPAVQQGLGFSVSTGSWTFDPAVNYPWQHGGPDNALVISFGEPCPDEISLTLSSESVRPQLWLIDKFFRPIRFLNQNETMSVVTAHVRRCPPQASSIAVEFTVAAPQEGGIEAGGHVAHDSARPRPTGGFTQPPDYDGIGQRTASCIAALDAQGRGSCSVTYFSSQVSGVERISASVTGLLKAAEVKIGVEIPGLISLADIDPNIDPDPSKECRPGGQPTPFRLTGQTNPHPDNHWGTRDTITQACLLARDFFADSGAALGINDKSLRQGGMFDICGAWKIADTCTRTAPGEPDAPKGGHIAHRKGTSVDIDQRACNANVEGRCVPTIAVSRVFLQLACARQGGVLLPEPTYHCEWPK